RPGVRAALRTGASGDRQRGSGRGRHRPQRRGRADRAPRPDPVPVDLQALHAPSAGKPRSQSVRRPGTAAMSEAQSVRDAAPIAVAAQDWQELPPRARTLFVGATAIGYALSATVAAVVFCLSARPSWLWWLPPACALPAALFGGWLG